MFEESGYPVPSEQSPQEKRIAWSTKRINELMEMIDGGFKPPSTPFYDGNPNIRRGNIIFDYSEEEMKELYKCANDISYFANEYCTVMTDKGLQTIELRDYQEKMLQHFVDNRFSIVLASRQVGKCFFSSTDIEVIINNKLLLDKINKYKKKMYVLNDVIELKIYELWYFNISKHTILNNIKFLLYKLYSMCQKSV